MVNDPSAPINAKSYLVFRVGFRFDRYLENRAAIENTSVGSLIVAVLTKYCTEELPEDIIVPFSDEILVIVLNNDEIVPSSYSMYLNCGGVPIKVELEAGLSISLQKIADKRQVHMAYICKLALQNYLYG